MGWFGLINKKYSFFITNYLRSSKKTILFSALGLIIILTVLLSSMFYSTAQFDLKLHNEINTFKNYNVTSSSYLYNGYEARSVNHYDIGIDGWFNLISKQDNNSTVNFDKIASNLNSSLAKFVNQNKINKHISTIEISFSTPYLVILERNNTTLTDQLVNKSIIPDVVSKQIIVFELNNYYKNYFDSLKINTGFVQHNNALFIPMSPSEQYNTSNFSLYYNNNTFNRIAQYNITVKSIQYKIAFPELKNYENTAGILFISNLTSLLSSTNIPLSVKVNPALICNIDNINYDNFLSFYNKVKTSTFEDDFTQIMMDESLNQRTYSNYDNEIVVLHNMFNSEVLSQYTSNLIIILPYIFLGILMSNYSFNLYSDEIEQKIKIFKTKGIPKRLLFTILFIESIVVLLLATIISFFTAYFVTYIGLQANAFESVSFGTFPIYRINSIIYPFLLVYLIIIFLFNSLPRIIALMRIQYLEEETETEKKAPFWKRHYIDLWLVLVPAGIIILYLLVSLFITNTTELSIYTNLLIPFPFLLLVGLFMSTSRFINYFIDKLSHIFWKRGRLDFFMSFKNLQGIRNTLMRGFIIATILILITNTLIITTYTMENDTTVKLYKDQGFDFNAYLSSFQSADNKSFNNEIHSVYSRFENQVTPLVKIESFTFYNMKTSYSNNNQDRYLRFYVMNVSQVLHEIQRYNKLSELFPSYSEGQITKLLTSGSNGSIPIFVHKQTFEYNYPNENENFQIMGLNMSLNFTRVGEFNAFPSIAPGTGIYSPMPVIVDVMYRAQLEQFLTNYPTNSIQYQSQYDENYYFNLKPTNLNQKIALSKEIYQNLSLSNFHYDLIPLRIDSFLKTPSNVIIWGELLILITMSIVMLIGILCSFIANFYNQSKKNYFMEKALGVKNKQIYNQLVISALFFIVISIIIGILYSVIPFLLYYVITATSRYVNPAYILIPYNVLVIPYIMTILASLVVTILYLHYFGKISIDEGLQED